MAPFTSDFQSFPHRRPPAGCPVLWILCLVTLVVLPGCGGCRQTPEEREAEQKARLAREKAEKEKEKKPDLETGFLMAQPHGARPLGCYYKPGHWTATTLPARANNFDILGDLGMTVVDDGKPMELAATPYTSSGSREVALPKGRWKLLESVLYVPTTGRSAKALARIVARKGGRGDFQREHGLVRMPAHQYHFVVLARWPSNYKYLETLDSVRHPSEIGGDGSSRGFYRIQLLQADRQTTLPLHGLFWTSIAYVLWDDAEPDALTLKQQTALVDWLHWGGQLIVSGPDSLDGLRNSFLAPYLPATGAGTRTLTQADFEELSDWWRAGEQQQRKRRRPLVPVEPWTGVNLTLEEPASRAVPGTGGLLAERRVGRGRVVVSAFELNEPELLKWPGFDTFFNGCLLRRPARRFSESNDSLLGFELAWLDSESNREHEHSTSDAHHTCKLRYFSRDAGLELTPPPQESDEELPVAQMALPGSSGGSIEEALELAEDYGSGVGAWNDFSAAGNAARESLLSAARIEIPGRMFVVWVVSLYVLVLVPANWALFRWIGRIEWAWVAAPLIAVVCTVVVIRLAQLDIGFARSQTDIGIVEIQGGYPRAHVTRYTALYTALSTTYGIRFDDPGAQVQPFPRKTPTSSADFGRRSGEAVRSLQYRYGNDVSMRGFYVQSNTTGLVHSEQMVDLGGSISFTQTPAGAYEVLNETPFTLEDAGVARKDRSGNIRTAWIGKLEPKGVATLLFERQRQTNAAGGFWADRRNRSPLTAASGPADQLNFRDVVLLAEEPRETLPALDGRRGEVRLLGLRPGDVRLVAWLDQPVGGLEIRPAAPQAKHAAVVVAHLRYGHEDDPRPDSKTRVELKPQKRAMIGSD